RSSGGVDAGRHKCGYIQLELANKRSARHANYMGKLESGVYDG
ncbi:hypothetical protein PAT3040_02520, partial [Paenibacillus agaridevorans]